MLRDEYNQILSFLKDHVRPTVPEMKRGYVDVKDTGFHSEYAYQDDVRIATIMGIDIRMAQELADDDMNYYGPDGVLIHHV